MLEAIPVWFSAKNANSASPICTFFNFFRTPLICNPFHVAASWSINWLKAFLPSPFRICTFAYSIYIIPRFPISFFRSPSFGFFFLSLFVVTKSNQKRLDKKNLLRLRLRADSFLSQWKGLVGASRCCIMIQTCSPSQGVALC